MGFFNSLLTLLNQIIAPHGYSNDDAGTFGAVFIGLGLVGAGTEYYSLYVCMHICMYGFFTFQAYCMYGAYVVQLFLFVIFVVRIFHFLYEFEYSFLIVVVLVEVVVLVVVIVVVVVVWVVKEGGCSDSGSNAWRSRRNN